MAASVDIVVKVFDQASKALKDIAKANGDLGKGSKSTSEQLKSLGKAALGVTAAVAAFGVAAKTAFETGKQGAAIKQTGQSFEFLLSKVGASADTLDQLRTASRGTISDMALMSSTATLLAGAQGDLATELAKSTPQLLNIAKAAQKLNPALGDTTFLYDSLATGVKRASPMILDNLGLTIRIGAANEAFAKTLGKTVAALTADEQKQALLNETLRAGAVLIEQAGGTTESATDSYNQLTASVANLTDHYKEQVNEGLQPVVQATAEMVERLNESAKAAEFIDQAIQDLSGTMEFQGSWSNELATRVAELSANYQATAKDVEDAGGAIDATSGQIENLTYVTDTNTISSREMRQMEMDLQVALGETTHAIEMKKDKIALLTAKYHDEADASERTEQQTKDLALAIVTNTTALDGLTFELENAEQATKDLAATNAELLTSLLEVAASADKAMMGFQNSIRELSYMTDETVTAAQATAHFKQMEDDVAIALGDTNQTIVDQRNKVERLRQEWEDSNFTNKEVERQLYYSTINLDRYTNSFQDNTRNVETNTGALKDNNAINEAGRVLRDAISVATGRQTEKQVALRLEQERWANVYATSTGPDREHAFNMAIATAVALDAETQAHRNLQSSLSSTASGYNQVAQSAREALAAQNATIVEGVGIVSAKGDLRAAKIGEEWEEVHGEWRSGAGGRKEKEHIADVIKDMQQRHGFDPANPQKWGLDFLASQAGGGGTAFTNPENIKSALEAAAVGAQHGANFIVPQGFQNDNFLMGVSSGERVSVTPAHSTRAGGGMVIQNLNVYGVQTDSELFESVVRAARQRGRDFARVL